MDSRAAYGNAYHALRTEQRAGLSPRNREPLAATKT